MINGYPLPKRYYHNGFWLSRYGAVDMLLYLWAFDKCPYWLQKNYVVKKQVPSYFLLQFVIAVTASDGDCYLSNFRPRQCGLFIVILSSTLSLKTVVFFYLLFVLRSLSPRLKYSRIALCMDALPYAPYFRQRFAPFFRHRRRSQGYLKSRHRLLAK